MKKILNSTLNLFLLNVLLAITVLSSCNKDFGGITPTDVSRADTVGKSAGKRVLYVVMDGVSGDAVQALAPATISSLLSRSVYTFQGLSDDQRSPITNATAWTNMFTGLDATKHKVLTDDFANYDMQTAPSIFTRLKQSSPSIRTVAFTTSDLFNQKLASDATEQKVLATDEQVKDATIAELTNGNPYFVAAKFHDADVAGTNGGYDITNATYADAITKLDRYLGELLGAIQKRQGIKDENWLIVVASNKSGGPSGSTAPDNIYNDKSRNTFLLYYNAKFSTRNFVQPDPNSYPFVGKAVRMLSTTTSNGQGLLANTSVGDFGTTGDYTVMIKLRSTGSTVSQYAHLLGNMANTYTDREGGLGNGWDISCWNDSYYLNIDGGYSISAAVPIRNGLWQAIAFKFFTDNARRYVALFHNGKKLITFDITGKNLTSAAAPLHIGPGKAIVNTTDSRFGGDFQFRDLLIYNYALTDDDLIATARQDMSLSAPNPTRLLGWWPMNEGTGAILKDMSAAKNDFNLNTATLWSDFNELSPNIAGVITQQAYKAVPNGIDVPVLIYNWLNVSIPSDWGITGKLYTPTINLPIN
jgi:hypothetical protein